MYRSFNVYRVQEPLEHLRRLAGLGVALAGGQAAQEGLGASSWNGGCAPAEEGQIGGEEEGSEAPK